MFLSRPPEYAWESLRHDCPKPLGPGVDMDAWVQDGDVWLGKRHTRVQHVLSHMNHHIHPLKEDGSGERKLLAGCKNKSNPNVCKGGFPLQSEMTPRPLLVCRCVAQERGLAISGQRSMLGAILPARNEPNLNAGPVLWSEFTGSNGDIKFPLRVPILPAANKYPTN